MSDETAFLSAIRAAPDEDTLRLVFADWLQERDDPRAEYLRLDVEIIRHTREGRVVPPALATRRFELKGLLDQDWVRAVSRPMMRDPTEIRDWHEFYDTLTIEPGYHAPVPKPTVAQLDRFEVETGFQLPRSYREYILLFGPGKLLTDWDIAAPGYSASWFYDLQTMHENMRPVSYLSRHPEAHRERVGRCRYFCSKYKDTFGWDPNEVTDHEAREYAVYRIIEDGRVVRVGDSFRDFVEDAVLHMLTLPDWDEEELGSPLRFEPATR